MKRTKYNDSMLHLSINLGHVHFRLYDHNASSKDSEDERIIGNSFSSLEYGFPSAQSVTDVILGEWAVGSCADHFCTVRLRVELVGERCSFWRGRFCHVFYHRRWKLDGSSWTEKITRSDGSIDLRLNTRTRETHWILNYFVAHHFWMPD